MKNEFRLHGVQINFCRDLNNELRFLSLKPWIPKSRKIRLHDFHTFEIFLSHYPFIKCNCPFINLCYSAPYGPNCYSFSIEEIGDHGPLIEKLHRDFVSI